MDPDRIEQLCNECDIIGGVKPNGRINTKTPSIEQVTPATNMVYQVWQAGERWWVKDDRKATIDIIHSKALELQATAHIMVELLTARAATKELKLTILVGAGDGTLVSQTLMEIPRHGSADTLVRLSNSATNLIKGIETLSSSTYQKDDAGTVHPKLTADAESLKKTIDFIKRSLVELKSVHFVSGIASGGGSGGSERKSRGGGSSSS